MGKISVNSGIIDIEAIHRLLAAIGGDPEDLEELLDDFQNEAPELVDRMQSASRSDDIEALRIAAHTLKSNSRDFGAMGLSAICKTLEQECREKQVLEPREKVEKIATQTELALNELCKIIAAGLYAEGEAD